MHGFLYPALAAMTVEGCSPDRRGRRLSNFGAAFNLGAGLSLLISGWLARISSYPAAFLTIGAFTVLSAFAFLRSGPSPQVEPVADP
jgi:MFS family permease